jgi:hypothetical protein
MFEGLVVGTVFLSLAVFAFHIVFHALLACTVGRANADAYSSAVEIFLGLLAWSCALSNPGGIIAAAKWSQRLAKL